MGQYRKKPVVIEAVQLQSSEWLADAKMENGLFKEIPDWLGDALRLRHIKPQLPAQTDYVCLVIPTLEGDHIATPGDWIIRGVKGELYPCKPDIFALTYEPVTP